MTIVCAMCMVQASASSSRSILLCNHASVQLAPLVCVACMRCVCTVPASRRYVSARASRLCLATLPPQFGMCLASIRSHLFTPGRPRPHLCSVLRLCAVLRVGSSAAWAPASPLCIPESQQFVCTSAVPPSRAVFFPQQPCALASKRQPARPACTAHVKRHGPSRAKDQRKADRGIAKFGACVKCRVPAPGTLGGSS